MKWTTLATNPERQKMWREKKKNKWKTTKANNYTRLAKRTKRWRNNCVDEQRQWYRMLCFMQTRLRFRPNVDLHWFELVHQKSICHDWMRTMPKETTEHRHRAVCVWQKAFCAPAPAIAKPSTITTTTIPSPSPPSPPPPLTANTNTNYYNDNPRKGIHTIAKHGNHIVLHRTHKECT